MEHHVDRSSELLPPVSVDQRLHGCKSNANDVMHGPDHGDHQEIMPSHYINIHRLQDNLPKVQLDPLSNDLLGHHVVEISPSGTIVSPNSATNYYGEDLLGNDLTEEDKRLAAALVAVQLVQQQKQNSILASELLNGKNMAPLSPFVPSTVEKPGMAAMVTSYIQAFEEESAAQHLLEPPPPSNDRTKAYSPPPQLPDLRLPPLPPLKKVLSTQNLLRNKSKKSFLEQQLESEPIKNCIEEAHKISKMDDIEMAVEDPCLDDLDSDYEIDSELKPSRRSLPHKKRIPRKLKTQPQRNIHNKCYKCQKCGDSFSNQSSFFNHRSQHSNPPKRQNTFSCEICPFQNSNQIQFFEHLKSHYEPKNAVESVIQTDLEDFSESAVPALMDSFSLKADTTKKPGQLTSPITCEICCKSFKRHKAYESHKASAHPHPVEEFSEPEDMMEGIRHVVNIQTHCPDDEQEDKHLREWKALASTQESVETQSKTFTQSDSYDESTPLSHFLLDNEKKKKSKLSLPCPHCPRVFMHRNSLLYHIGSHTGRRPHQCDVCGKRFFANNALRVHMRTHSGVKPYKCETCGRCFRQWGDLKYHITSLHSNTKQYQCEFCGKDFARKYSLIVHRRIHTNEKNYVCEYCCKTFRASSYLVNHRRIHTGEKPHVCEICSKAFRVKSDLKRHLNTHNKERSSTASSGTALVISQHPATSIETQPIITSHVNHLTSSSLSSDQTGHEEPECILPDVATAPLNLMRTDNADGLTYARESVTIDRDQNTLYVWLPTGADSILSDE